jgi:hypothetical protein
MMFISTCKKDDMFVPLIAVIDEADGYDSATADWNEFHKKYPDRPFCLLIPNKWWGDKVDVPDEAREDPKFTAWYKIARDEGTGTPSNWFELCKRKLEGFNSTNVRSIGLLVAQTGSMTKSTVEKSYNKLLQDAEDANITVCEVFNSDLNWITPFNTELIPNSETCIEADVYESTPWPTFTPTVISAFPTAPSTNVPTWTTDDGKKGGNICLTKRDRYRTCFQRQVDPKYSNLTKDSILRAQYNKGARLNCSEDVLKPNESYIKPYTPPYITANETLTSNTIYFSLLTAELFNESLSCDQQLLLEEFALEWSVVSCSYRKRVIRSSLPEKSHLFNSYSLHDRIMPAGQTPILQYAHSLMSILFSGCGEMVLSKMNQHF